jgi:predicted dienelactone hydrolase
MRIFEIFLLIGLFLSAIGILFLRNIKFKVLLPTVSVMLFCISVSVEGYRFAMLPAYILALSLFAFSLAKLFLKAKKRHPVLKGFGIAVFCLAYFISIALPAFLPVVNLPKPSGYNEIGTMRIDFTETARKNILTGKSSQQKIAVQVWYPALNTSGLKRANWMDNRQTASLFAKYEGLPDLFGQFCQVRTNSYWNAAISGKASKYPVILFSSGAGMFSDLNTIQMEEIASQGFVVFAVSHPNDDFAVIYSDGSIMPGNLEQSSALAEDSKQAIAAAKRLFPNNENNPDFQRALIRNCKLNNENVRVWSDDMSFVADQISKLNDGSLPSIFTDKLDMSNLGIFGHSFGGAAAGETCLNDSRFKAFVNMDGTPFGDTVDRVIQQPFMILTEKPNQNAKLPVSDGYSKNQKNFTTVYLNQSQHMNFTDFNTIIPSFGKAFGILGTIDANRQNEVMNSYIVSFFNKYLKGMHEPTLDAATSQYSEVTIDKR